MAGISKTKGKRFIMAETEKIEEQLSRLSSQVELLSLRMQNMEKTGEKVGEVLDLLKGQGMSTGLIAIAERNKALVTKHEELLCGNGKKGLVQRVEDLEKQVGGVFGGGSKILWAIILSAVAVLGTGLGALIVEWFKR